MNSVCVLLIAFAFAFQSVAGVATTVAAYAGTTDGTNTWTPPVTTAACAAGTTTGVKYETFPLTVAATGVHQFRCMFEQVWRNTGRALIYTGTTFSATASCTGLVHEVADNLGLTGGPHLNDGVYLTAGTYTVVVTGTSVSDTGLFACNVLSGEYNSNTTGSATRIYPISSDQSESCSSSSVTNGVPAGFYSWTQPTTGLYDIFVYFANSTYDTTTTSFGANAALYRGSIAAQFNSTSVTNPNDPCDSKFTTSYIVSSRFSSKFVEILQNISLTATNAYTLVVAGDHEAAVGYYSVSVDPTIIRTSVNSAGTWTQPARVTDPTTPCTDSSNTGCYFFPFTFIAQYPTYIFDTQGTNWANDNIDTYSFLYTGINNASVPATCSAAGGISLIYSGDTGDVRPLAFLGLNVGSYYTVLVSAYSGGGTKGTFGIYAMTGSQIGVVPTGTATSTTGSSSESSVVGVSFVLLLIAAFFAML